MAHNFSRMPISEQMQALLAQAEARYDKALEKLDFMNIPDSEITDELALLIIAELNRMSASIETFAELPKRLLGLKSKSPGRGKLV